jgi:hypothetical protein
MLFDYSHGFYYKTSSLKYVKITDDAWHDKAILYIEQALNGTIKPTYISEEPGDRQNQGAVVRLVGKTYEAFVNDTEHDLVIYYYAALDALETGEFQAAADEVVRNGTSTIRFASINRYRNACAEKFPDMVNNPQVELIPARNKSATAIMLGLPGKDAFLRFFKAHASLPNSIVAPPMTAAIALREKAHWLMYIDDLRDDLARKVRQYIGELDLVINQSTKEKGPAKKAWAEL